MPELKKTKDTGKSAISKYQPFLNKIRTIETDYKKLNPKEFGMQVAEIYEELQKRGREEELGLVSQKLQESDLGLLIRSSILDGDWSATTFMFLRVKSQTHTFLAGPFGSAMDKDFGKFILSLSDTYNRSSKSDTNFGMAISAVALDATSAAYAGIDHVHLKHPESFALLEKFDLLKGDLFKIKRAEGPKDMKAGITSKRASAALRKIAGESESIIETLMKRGEEGENVSKWVRKFYNSLGECWFAASLRAYGYSEEEVNEFMVAYASGMAKRNAKDAELI